MRNSERLSLIAGGLIVTTALLYAAAQAPRPSVVPDSPKVTLNLMVTDDLNRLVTDLSPDSFQIFEDKVPQPIVSVSKGETPVSIGVVIDTSASVGAAFESVRSAVTELFKTLGPENEAFLVEFADRPELAAPVTHDFKDIENRLAEATPKGRTALRDGIYLALDTLKTAHNPRKALIVISDGGDTSSRYTAAEVASRIRETDVQIFTVGIFENGAGRVPDYFESEVLRSFSEPTGGRHFEATTRDLPDLGAKLGIEMQSQFYLSYNPTNPAHDGKYRKITVKLVAARGLHTFSRAGYFAPTQ